MIHVDLSVLESLFHLLGEKNEFPTGKTAELYNSLDLWQKNQLNNAWMKGKEDKESLQN